MSEPDSETFNRRVVSADGYVALTEFEDAYSSFEAEVEPPHLEYVERGAYVARYARKLIEGTDARLLTPSVLARLTGFRTAAQRLRNFEQDENTAHLDTLVADFDALVDQLAVWPRQDAAVEGLRNDAASFRSSATRQLGNFKTEAEASLAELRGEIETVESSVAGASRTLATVETEQESLATTVAQSATTWATEFSAAQTQREQEFDAAEASRSEEAAKAHTERQTAFAEKLDEWEAEAAASRKKSEAESARIVGDADTTFSTALDDLATMKAKAEKLVGAIGSTGLSGGFQKQADEECEAAARYRNFASWTGVVWGLVSLAVFVSPYLIEAWLDHSPDTGITAMLARLTVTAPLIVLFGYFVAESAKHRHTENHLRKLELNLASIDPYLAEFDARERSDLKAEFARVWFSAENPSQKRRSKDNPASANHALGRLTELAKPGTDAKSGAGA